MARCFDTAQTSRPGANVVATGRRIKQGQELEIAGSSLPGSILFVQADVTVADDVKRMIGTAVDKFGGLDFAFNNAGAARQMDAGDTARLHEYTDEDLEQGYNDLAEQTGKNVAKIRVEYRERQKREMLIGMILEDKVLDLLEKSANITEASPAASTDTAS